MGLLFCWEPNLKNFKTKYANGFEVQEKRTMSVKTPFCPLIKATCKKEECAFWLEIGKMLPDLFPPSDGECSIAFMGGYLLNKHRREQEASTIDQD